MFSQITETLVRCIMNTVMLLLSAQMVFAQQQHPVSFAEIDQRVKLIEPAPPAELALTLTKDYSTDTEKLRSIFSWIADHISYRVRKKNTRAGNYSNNLLFTDTSGWKSANDRMAEMVLQSKSAVCDGYARLFKSLCDFAGLRSAVITGFAKSDLSRQPPFRCNHTWNAVYIDSGWHLLDITWASGYTSYSGDEFYKFYDEKYFLATPEAFLRDHFPDDLRWTLMEKPVTPQEFDKAPYRNRSFTKYRISTYTPQNGIIEAFVGDTINIFIETGDPVADSKTAADTITHFDNELQKITPSIAILEPSCIESNGHQIRYSFYATDTTTEWLQIVYNHDTILRYRLHIRKPKSALAANTRPGFRGPDLP